MPYAQLWRSIKRSSYVNRSVYVQLCNVWIDIAGCTVCYVKCMANCFSESFCCVFIDCELSAVYCVAVSGLRSVGAGFKWQRPGLNPRLVHLAFVLFAATVEPVSVRRLRFDSVRRHYANHQDPHRPICGRTEGHVVFPPTSTKQPSCVCLYKTLDVAISEGHVQALIYKRAVVKHLEFLFLRLS
jgi:hypothetical protein